MNGNYRLPVKDVVDGVDDKHYIILEVDGVSDEYLCELYDGLVDRKPVYYTLIDAHSVIKRINGLEKEIIKLENGFKMLEEENTRLNKFFLYSCKSKDYINWLKENSNKI